TLPGFAPASVPVTLSDNSPAPSVTIQLTNQLGRIQAVITGGNGHFFPGATISATNDRQTFTGTSSTADGSYVITNLQPGSYSVTVTAPNQQQQTALVTVTAGVTTIQNLQLKQAS